MSIAAGQRLCIPEILNCSTWNNFTSKNNTLTDNPFIREGVVLLAKHRQTPHSNAPNTADKDFQKPPICQNKQEEQRHQKEKLRKFVMPER